MIASSSSWTYWTCMPFLNKMSRSSAHLKFVLFVFIIVFRSCLPMLNLCLYNLIYLISFFFLMTTFHNLTFWFCGQSSQPSFCPFFLLCYLLNHVSKLFTFPSFPHLIAFFCISCLYFLIFLFFLLGIFFAEYFHFMLKLQGWGWRYDSGVKRERGENNKKYFLNCEDLYG